MVSAPETKVAEVPKVEKTETEASSSKASTEHTSPDVNPKEAEAVMSFTQGKKALLLNDPQSAVDHFASACALMSEVYGDLAVEMCDYHFSYGKALLELARLEDNVLGNALTGVPADSELEDSQVEDPDKLSPEEKEEVAEKVDEALAENFKKSKKEDNTENEAEAKDEAEKVEDEVKKPEEAEKPEVEKEENSDEAEKAKEEEPKEDSKMDTEGSQDEGSEDTADDDAPAESGDEDTSQDGSQDEDVSSLQLAFEVLEIAKTIYLKIANRTESENLKLAQVYLKLGEVEAENERYEETIKHYKDCLSIQELFLSADDRLLAETNYQLGSAYLLADQHETALTFIESASQIIKLRMNNKIKVLAKMDIEYSADLEDADGKWSDQVKTVVKDIRDLDSLLPELNDKLADCREIKIQFAQQVKHIKDMAKDLLAATSSIGESSSSTGFPAASTSSSTEAKPIAATMIRKKRKPEDEAVPEEEANSKKSRTESADNGSTKA